MSVNIFKYRTPVSEKVEPVSVLSTSSASDTATTQPETINQTFQVEISATATVTLSGRLDSSLSYVQFYSTTANAVVTNTAGFKDVQVSVTSNTGTVDVWMAG